MKFIVNSTILRDFFGSEARKSHIEFTKTANSSYSKICNWFETIPEFEGKNYYTSPNSLRNENKSGNENRFLDTAREFTFLLPSHTLKMYDTLIKLERRALEQEWSHALNKPIVTYIDNGCGGGSASIALLMLLENFQVFKLEKDIPIFPITINLLGIDPNDFALDIFTNFICEYSSQLSKYLISVNLAILNGTLSSEGSKVISWLNNLGRLNNCIIAFGNIIRPLDTEYGHFSFR